MDGEIRGRLNASIENLIAAIAELRSEIGVIRENIRTDFSRLVDLQDSHFRWLMGSVLGSAVLLGTFLYHFAIHPA